MLTKYTLNNELTFNTVATQLKNVSDLIKHHDLTEIDLSNITCIDSAGIALLTTLKNLAAASNKNLQYSNPTQDIIRLNQLYNLCP